MKIVKEKFKTDRNNKLYWGRVYFISDNREWKAKILWAMSLEWVRLQLLAEKWSDREVDKLVNKVVVQKWKNAGRSVFNRRVQHEALAADGNEKTRLAEYLVQKEGDDRLGQ